MLAQARLDLYFWNAIWLLPFLHLSGLEESCRILGSRQEPALQTCSRGEATGTALPALGVQFVGLGLREGGTSTVETSPQRDQKKPTQEIPVNATQNHWTLFISGLVCNEVIQ